MAKKNYNELIGTIEWMRERLKAETRRRKIMTFLLLAMFSIVAAMGIALFMGVR